MSDTVLASIFLVMLLAPCVVAMFGDKRKESKEESTPTHPEAVSRRANELGTLPARPSKKIPLKPASAALSDAPAQQDIPSYSKFSSSTPQSAEQIRVQALLNRALAAKNRAAALTVAAQTAAARAEEAAERLTISELAVARSAALTAAVRDARSMRLEDQKSASTEHAA